MTTHRCTVCGTTFSAEVHVSPDCELGPDVWEATETCADCAQWAGVELLAHHLMTGLEVQHEPAH